MGKKLENMLTNIRAELKARVDGRTLIREKKYTKSNIPKPYREYNLYFDTPTSSNKAIINEIISGKDISLYGLHIEGGSYGYRYTFRIEKGE